MVAGSIMNMMMMMVAGSGPRIIGITASEKGGVVVLYVKYSTPEYNYGRKHDAKKPYGAH